RTSRLVAAGMAALLTPAVAAAQVCVDPAGNGCETTIQAGIDAAAAGQTVTVAPGRYQELVTIPAAKAGLRLNASGAILDNTVQGNEEIAAIQVLANDVTIAGLRIRNGDTGIIVGDDDLIIPSGLTLRGVAVEATAYTCVEIHGADDVAIDGSTFASCRRRAIDASSGPDFEGSDGVAVTKSTFRICGSGCIEIDGDDAIVSANKIQQSVGDGIAVNGNDARVEKNKVASGNGGIDVRGASPSIVKNKVTYAIGTAIEAGCDAACAAGEGVVGNKVKYTGDDDNGFFIRGDEAGLIVEKNSVDSAMGDGFFVFGTGVVLTVNKATNNGGDTFESGFDILGSDHVLTGNTASGNANDGFHVRGDGHVLTDNESSGNYGDGFDVDDYNSEPSPVDITLSGNTATDNVGHGFALATDPGNLDPIDVTYTGNAADGNRASFCDSATAGAPTDGGGNSFTIVAAGPCEVDRD
ncbi:MAG TPA: right-handed parallel beta-helix repeat-containing protein, partial [Candidatus Binatia bacterium]|nr:right-handed parallel beta-helix repeat-containing protein [Candidatus Binatia bacterium]